MNIKMNDVTWQVLIPSRQDIEPDTSFTNLTFTRKYLTDKGKPIQITQYTYYIYVKDTVSLN